MAKPFPISATIITHNEENNIERCLLSLQEVADEIIVVDSHSTDHTVKLAESLGAKVYTQTFLGHIEQKNWAMAKTSNDMVLSLDADEALSDSLKESILNIKKVEAAFIMPRKNFFCGQWIRYGGWYPDKKIRLWNKNLGQWGGKNPHDQVLMHQKEAPTLLAGDILHYSYNHKHELPKQLNYFASIAAEAYHLAGKKSNPWLIKLNPIFTFIKVYLFKLGFLDGKNGYFIAKERAKANRKKYKLLYALQQKHTH